jgi:hypothetical protein
VVIGSNGTVNATQSAIGISYQIIGTPGATGTVTATVYTDNPQPTATVPSGNSLTSFIAISFNMNADDFAQATLTLTYNESQVSNIKQPYEVFKYNSESNSYVEWPAIIDTSARTITVTLNSIGDPLIAIGGVAASSTGVPTSTWIIIIVVIIIVILVNVVIIRRMRTQK